MTIDKIRYKYFDLDGLIGHVAKFYLLKMACPD